MISFLVFFLLRPQEKRVSETFSSYAQVGISTSYSDLCVCVSAVMSELNVAMCFRNVLASVCYANNSFSRSPVLFPSLLCL